MQLQLYYCIASLGSVVLFLTGPLLTTHDLLCKAVSILLHYALLTSFSWLTVISVDMYKMFQSIEAMQKASERSGCRDMIVQQVLAWGTPALMVVMSVVVDNTPPDTHDVKPHYGERRCWLSSETYAILAFFGIPICIAVILNILLFVVLSVRLRKAMKHRDNMTSTVTSTRGLYLRLFLLMGVGSGFLLLTPFIDHIVVWILIILTTASQGVYIGAVSLFSRQVLTCFRLKFSDGNQLQENIRKSRVYSKSMNKSIAVNTVGSEHANSSRQTSSTVETNVGQTSSTVATNVGHVNPASDDSPVPRIL